MPTTHPRISAVVERPLYEALESLAKRDHMSISQKARDLLLKAVEWVEDIELATLVRDRKARKGKLLSHKDLWESVEKS